MTGSAWTRWTLYIMLNYILRGGVRGGEWCQILSGRRLVDDGKRSDALDVVFKMR